METSAIEMNERAGFDMADHHSESSKGLLGWRRQFEQGLLRIATRPQKKPMIS